MRSRSFNSAIDYRWSKVNAYMCYTTVVTREQLELPSGEVSGIAAADLVQDFLFLFLAQGKPSHGGIDTMEDGVMIGMFDELCKETCAFLGFHS